MTPLTVVEPTYRTKRKKLPPRAKKRKKTKIALWREFGVPDNAYRRYQGIKGIFWYYFSLYIRERDVRMYGTCISCGRGITVDNCDAGHFMPAGQCGRDLLFDEINVNAECKSCNGFDETHLFGYAEGLDRRYGEGTAIRYRFKLAEIKAQRKQGMVEKDWKAGEYEEKIRALPNFKEVYLLNL